MLKVGQKVWCTTFDLGEKCSQHWEAVIEDIGETLLGVKPIDSNGPKGREYIAVRKDSVYTFTY